MARVLSVLDVFFFFSSRRRHTRCALVTGVQTCALPISDPGPGEVRVRLRANAINYRDLSVIGDPAGRNIALPRIPNSDGAGEVLAVGAGVDRKSVVSGKSLSVRVDLGGRRIIKKKKSSR